MLFDPVIMGELRSKKEKHQKVSMQQKPLPKHKTATETFFRKQKKLKGRK